MVAASIDVAAHIASSPPSIRLAQSHELDEIRSMQRLSMRSLGRRYYSAQQIAALVRFMVTTEAHLIDDQTYYVAQVGGRIVGCGGWSIRTPLYQASSYVELDARQLPKVRAMYVHPQFARRGVGRQLLDVVEEAIRARGYASATLEATLPGVPLYRRCGYQPVCVRDAVLPGGVKAPIVCMHKDLVAGAGL